MFYIFFQIKNYAVWLVSLKLGCSHRSAPASTRLCFVTSTSTKCSSTHIRFVTAITAVEKYIPEYCTPVIFRCTAHRQQLSKSKFFKFAQYNCKFGSYSSDQLGSKSPSPCIAQDFQKWRKIYCLQFGRNNSQLSKIRNECSTTTGRNSPVNTTSRRSIMASRIERQHK